MKSFIFFIMIISMLLIINCSQQNMIQKEYLGSDGIILDNNASTGELKFDRYNLNDIKIVGDSIKINISYSGGCRDHEFKLIAQNYFIETDPLKVELVLSHNSNFDPCERYVTEEHSFNLLPLKYEYYKKFGRESGKIQLVLDEKEIDYSF